MANNSSRSGITNLLIGFLGVIGAAVRLPRLFRFGFKRYFMSFVSEILLIIISGLLTEKLVTYLTRDESEPAGPPSN